MCLVPTSLAQHFHGYDMAPKFPNCIVTQHTVFCIGNNYFSGEMLGTPIQCHIFATYDDAGQKTRLK